MTAARGAEDGTRAGVGAQRAVRLRLGQVDHGRGQEWIPVNFERSVTAQHFLDISRKESSDVGNENGGGILDDVDPSPESVVLMGDGVVQGLADDPGIVLRDLLGKEDTTWHHADRQVTDATENTIDLKDTGRSEMFVIESPVPVVLENPRDLGDGERQ